MQIDAIKAFHDNYLWAYRPDANAADCIIVDPGEASPVLDYLKQSGLRLNAIWITHHHADHQGGVGELLRHFAVPVYGPASETIHHGSHPLTPGEVLNGWQILDLGGHTAGHIGYYQPHLHVLFCGDTLFAGGCGRVFDGTYAQLHASLQRIATLPPETLIYCAHEYTQANLQFAQKVEPHNAELFARVERVAEQRQQDIRTVPSRLADELATNPFLRCHLPAVRTAAEQFAGKNLDNMEAVFTALREWKNMG